MAMPFFFFACEDQNLTADTPTLYGQKDTADDAYISRLNSYNSSPTFSSNGTDFTSRLNSLMGGPTEGLTCGGAAGEVDIGPDVDSKMTEEQRAFLDSEVGDPPRSGGRVSTQLPDANRGTDDAAKYGYYRYKDGDNRVYGTERTIWRLRAAGKLLAQQKLVMGVGDISKSGGGKIPPHQSHRNGRDVDLRLLGPNGEATQCRVTNSSCYSQDNTFKMLKALIDVDPKKVRTILVNDATLRSRINAYYRAKTGETRSITQYCTGHDNHIHFSWNE
ncbi:MAG: hypothetical protein ACJAT2_000289 [Bacteriovoracaceae bacterium]|jgi:hypothetical protein